MNFIRIYLLLSEDVLKTFVEGSVSEKRND